MILRHGDETREVSPDASTLRLAARGDGRFVLDRGDGCFETFHCVRDRDTIHLFWRGVAYRLVVEGRRGRRIAHAAGSLETPMPGKVIKVSAEVGQTVHKGDEILVVEAMKMENAVRAPRQGVVTNIAVKVGDMAEPGVALAEIE